MKVKFIEQSNPAIHVKIPGIPMQVEYMALPLVGDYLTGIDRPQGGVLRVAGQGSSVPF
jgi:hypothetical protein